MAEILFQVLAMKKILDLIEKKIEALPLEIGAEVNFDTTDLETKVQAVTTKIDTVADSKTLTTMSDLLTLTNLGLDDIITAAESSDAKLTNLLAELKKDHGLVGMTECLTTQSALYLSLEAGPVYIKAMLGYTITAPSAAAAFDYVLATNSFHLRELTVVQTDDGDYAVSVEKWYPQMVNPSIGSSKPRFSFTGGDVDVYYWYFK